jgi:phosphoenolpyruvate carboxykinase (GTP)
MSPSPLEQWVDTAAALTQPARVVWCDGSENEAEALKAGMVRDGSLLRLRSDTYPNCYLYRSHASDVARTEHLTFICTERKEDAGPTNNWMPPAVAKEKVGNLFHGAMKGRTMYVLPYLMGPPSSPYCKVGVEVTDSPYVAISMRIMTRLGAVALRQLGNSSDFAPGLHALGDLSPDRRFILHFPEERLIWSIGSGYGGNALLGKKCLSLRLASWMARQEGWLAEHMLILGLEDPSGKVSYMAAAFPSACGKTNLAMLVSPLAAQGYRVWTVGDDIAWMRIGADGRLWASNPENGFFGVAPGTGSHTNPNMMAAVQRDTIFTNVAFTPQGEPWWEGIGLPLPAGTLDWQGRLFSADESGAPSKGTTAAHPNSRFTVPTRRCPSLSPRWEDPQGVPISAIIFGGRRARVAPLVYQSFDWEHGVYVGATMASETTAAATGAVGVVRRDPMAMLPFCGYHMGDYFGHWLEMGRRLPNPPQIFHVNWFRVGDDGRFLWPGFGQNVRVLKWILQRVSSAADAREEAIGYVPTRSSLDLDGLGLSGAALDQLLSVDREAWQSEVSDHEGFLNMFGDRLPAELRQQRASLAKRLHSQAS